MRYPICMVGKASPINVALRSIRGMAPMLGISLYQAAGLQVTGTKCLASAGREPMFRVAHASAAFGCLPL